MRQCTLTSLIIVKIRLIYKHIDLQRELNQAKNYSKLKGGVTNEEKNIVDSGLVGLFLSLMLLTACTPVTDSSGTGETSLEGHHVGYSSCIPANS